MAAVPLLHGLGRAGTSARKLQLHREGSRSFINFQLSLC